MKVTVECIRAVGPQFWWATTISDRFRNS